MYAGCLSVGMESTYMRADCWKRPKATSTQASRPTPAAKGNHHTQAPTTNPGTYHRTEHRPTPMLPSIFRDPSPPAAPQAPLARPETLPKPRQWTQNQRQRHETPGPRAQRRPHGPAPRGPAAPGTRPCRKKRRTPLGNRPGSREHRKTQVFFKYI